jgi:hypothetical protein
MPGPVSDSYDVEWGTSSNGEMIKIALREVYEKLTNILDGKPPHFILDLVEEDLPTPISHTLTEKEWRLLRFSVERALDSI